MKNNATEKKGIQQFLQSSDLFNLLPQMLFLFDMNGDLIDANPAARDMCNLKRIDHHALNFSNIFHLSERVEGFEKGMFAEGISEDFSTDAELICSAVPVHVLLNFRRLKSFTDGEDAMLFICSDIRGVLNKQRKQLKSLHKQHLKRRIRLYYDIACLTVHECAQPLSALKLELGILQKGVETLVDDKKALPEFSDVLSSLSRLENIIQKKRAEQSEADGEVLEGFNLNEVLFEARDFFQHRFSAEGLGFELNSTVKEAPVYANRRFMLHLLIEVISFFEQIKELCEPSKETHFLVTLDQVIPATFILKVEGRFAGADVCHTSELSQFSQELNSLLSAFGMQANHETQAQRSSIQIIVPAHINEERTQLDFFARDSFYSEVEGSQLQSDRNYAK